jgi:hypothetical protein
MSNDIEPIIGSWYCCRVKGQVFQVLDLDDADGLVEIQRFDGNIEEIDMESWSALELDFAEPPEDWTGPIDDLNPDDLSYSATEMQRDDWRNGTGEYPQGREAWEPDDDEASLDDRENQPPAD